MQVHRFVAASIHLPPTSHSLRDGEALTLPGLIALDLALWKFQDKPQANQAHIPFENVPDLGQFVQARAPQKAAYPCYSRII